MRLDRLHRLLMEQIERLRAEQAWAAARTVVTISGGVPGPSRWAYIHGLRFEPQDGESREHFEMRVLQEGAALVPTHLSPIIIFGGLPTLPGAGTFPPRPGMAPRQGGSTSWWDGAVEATESEVEP